MPRQDQNTRLLSAKKYLQGKTVPTRVSALTESDLQFVMMALGSGTNPQALSAALAEYLSDPASAHLTVQEEQRVVTSGGSIIQLYSLLRDPVQQTAWGLGTELLSELRKLESLGNTGVAVTRLSSHIESTKHTRGGKVAKVVEGSPPKGKVQSALTQLVANHCTPKQRSRAILCVKVPGSEAFSAVESYWHVQGDNKKDVENAARLAYAGKMPELRPNVKACGVLVNEVHNPASVARKPVSKPQTTPAGGAPLDAAVIQDLENLRM